MSNTHETFTTLDELINSHLSKLSNSGHTQDSDESMATGTSMKTGTTSDIQLLNSTDNTTPTAAPKQVDNEIINVLATQLANTLKAREVKTPQEKHIIEEETEESLNIDFTNAIIESQRAKEDTCVDYKPREDGCYDVETDTVNIEKPSSRPNDETKTTEESPSCPEDLSHLLNVKIKNTRCSTFGRVLCATYKSTYLLDRFHLHKNGIREFDFSTPSPDEESGKAKMTSRTPYLYKKHGVTQEQRFDGFGSLLKRAFLVIRMRTAVDRRTLRPCARPASLGLAVNISEVRIQSGEVAGGRPIGLFLNPISAARWTNTRFLRSSPRSQQKQAAARRPLLPAR